MIARSPGYTDDDQRRTRFRGRPVTFVRT